MKLTDINKPDTDLSINNNDTNEFNKYSEMLKETLEIDSSLNSTKYESKVEKRVAPVLIVEISNELEAKFLVDLCKKSSESSSETLIELCVRFEKFLKPIGFINFTFDNVIKILSYNKEFTISIKRDKEVFLDSNMIINLP